MIHEYKITVQLEGGYYYEPMDCPSRWQGSHVYDRLAPCFGEVIFTVWAKDEAEARAIVDKHDYEFNGDWVMHEVEDVTVTDVQETGRTDEDEDTASIEDVEYGRSWEPDYYEPEPPERED